jgi:hypothetical protein
MPHIPRRTATDRRARTLDGRDRHIYAASPVAPVLPDYLRKFDG